METVIEHIIAFVEKIKNDPNLSDLFRDAAHELHTALSPAAAPVAPAAPVAEPAQVEEPAPTAGG